MEEVAAENLAGGQNLDDVLECAEQENEAQMDGSEEEVHVCAYCFMIFNTEEALTKHLALCAEGSVNVKEETLHPGEEPDWNSDSELNFEQDLSYLEEFKQAVKPEFLDNDDNNFGKIIKSEISLEAVKDNDLTHLCSQCGQGFSRKALLAKHMEKHRLEKQKAHKLEQRRVCRVCGKSYANQYILVYHMRKVHGQEVELHKCQKCKESFKRAADLNIHTIKYHCGKGCKCPLHSSQWQKDRECTICERIFTCGSQLKQHMLTHQYVRTLQCQVCAKKFLNKGGLVSHMKVHKAVNVADPKRKFKCWICSQVLDSKESLNKHDVMHMFECAGCHIIILGLSNLQRHLRQTHDGTRAYACKACKKFFTEKIAVEYHIETTHTSSVEYREIPASFAPRKDGNNVEFKKSGSPQEKRKIFKFQKPNSPATYKVTCKNVNELCDEIKPNFQCGNCGIKLLNNSGVQDHLLHIHGTNKFFYCDECNTMFTDLPIIAAHMVKFHPKTALAEQDKESASFQESAQKLEVKPESASFQESAQELEVKPEISITLEHDNNNLAPRAEEPNCAYICGECGEGLVNEPEIRLHMQNQHSSNIYFTCDLCDRAFKGVPSMKAHMKNVHANYAKI